jgi:hypothetical protein
MSSRRKLSPISIFLSYSSKDKRFAQSVKDIFLEFGFAVFLAPEDISPASDWVQTILENLDDCDVFVAIVTKSYHGSNWTDQESGYAVARQKTILPICRVVDPYGFLARIQGYKKKRGTSDAELVEEALSGLLNKPPLRNRIRESLIAALRHSRSYPQSIMISRVLLKLSPFSGRQMSLIMKHAISQSQVRNSIEASKYLSRLVRRNQTKLDPELHAKFRKTLNV